MADTNNGNGERKRMEAVAYSVQLQAWARLSMVTAPPIIGALVAIAGWFLASLVGEVKATNEKLTTYITQDTAAGTANRTKIADHDRRIGNLEGRVFGFTPAPQPARTDP